MELKDYLRDITSYVSSTGFFDKIKVTATSNDILVEAMEKDKEIILKGKFSKPLVDLEGEFGLNNLSLLQTICNDPEFGLKESIASIVYETKNGENVPSEIAYVNKSKSKINYRFMSKNLIPQQPKFMEPKWNLTITPTKANVQQFALIANGLSSYEQYFIPVAENGELTFYLGDEGAATQRGSVSFATELTENFKTNHSWKILQVLSILKLADSCDCTIAFSDKGAIQITLNTGIGIHKYILPAKVR